MSKITNRAILRGMDDNRKFCYGVCNGFPGETAEKCRKCKAYAYNAEPPED